MFPIYVYRRYFAFLPRFFCKQGQMQLPKDCGNFTVWCRTVLNGWPGLRPLINTVIPSSSVCHGYLLYLCAFKSLRKDLSRFPKPFLSHYFPELDMGNSQEQKLTFFSPMMLPNFFFFPCQLMVCQFFNHHKFPSSIETFLTKPNLT